MYRECLCAELTASTRREQFRKKHCCLGLEKGKQASPSISCMLTTICLGSSLLWHYEIGGGSV